MFITLEDVRAFLPQLKCSELGRDTLIIETVNSRENCGYIIIQSHLPESTKLMKGRTNSSKYPCHLDATI